MGLIGLEFVDRQIHPKPDSRRQWKNDLSHVAGVMMGLSHGLRHKGIQFSVGRQSVRQCCAFLSSVTEILID